MRVCLIPLKIEVRNPSANFHHFAQRLAEVAQHQPDLICLPECTFTGYLYTEQDFEKFAEPIPGQTTDLVSGLAKANHCYICFGMLETAKGNVYNSAVLIDRLGRIVLVHRKISEQPPFATGDDVQVAKTEFGRLAVLLCGDLFEEKTKAMLNQRADILILPLARSFDGKSPDLERWLKEERQAYAEEVGKVEMTGLIVNLLEASSEPEASFGGAMIINPNGEILAEVMHGTDDVLIFDLVAAKTGAANSAS